MVLCVVCTVWHGRPWYGVAGMKIAAFGSANHILSRLWPDEERRKAFRYGLCIIYGAAMVRCIGVKKATGGLDFCMCNLYCTMCPSATWCKCCGGRDCLACLPRRNASYVLYCMYCTVSSGMDWYCTSYRRRKIEEARPLPHLREDYASLFVSGYSIKSVALRDYHSIWTN